MIWAILISIFSVVAGALLAFMPRGRGTWMGPMRTFGLMAAMSVVVMHLLPESLAQAGAWAILVFLAGLLAPEVLGKLGAVIWRVGHDESHSTPDRQRNMALEASYVGLLVHNVGDGIGLGAFTGELQLSHGNGGVITALAAHAVPVAAIVVLTFDSVRGRGSAIKRAIGLAAASVAGVLIAHNIPAEVFASANGWISAFVGGMLLHVVTHDLGVDLPKNASERSLDILAGVLGVWVSFLGREGHEHGEAEHHHATRLFEDAITDFSIETGPLLIFGLLVGAALSTWGARIPARFFESRGHVRDAMRGTIVGAPLPLCSCSVLPISAGLKARGAGPALIVGFLLATPELGIETFALSVKFLGWEMAWMRLGGALLVSFAAAVALSLVVGRSPATVGGTSVDLEPQVSEGHWARRTLGAFDELFQHIGAWMILGIVGAALLEVGLPEEAFDGVQGWAAQFAIITLIAVPSYVCAPSATPLAAVLLAKGISPGAVLVGLLLGPATNVATIVFLRRWFGGKAAAVGIFTVVALAWLIGLFIDQVWQLTPTTEIGEHTHDFGWFALTLAVVSGALLIRACYKSGVRGFLATLQGEHGHAHGDGMGGHGGHGGHGDHGGHGGDHDHGPAHASPVIVVQESEHTAHGHAHGDGHGHSH